jgi:sterol 24-C-methyltransferase
MDGDMGRVTGLLRRDKDVASRAEMKSQIGEYTSLFDEKGADTRKNLYTDVVNKYYDLATDFYEFGWGHSFHFAPRHKWESLESSIERHELWLANRLGLTEGSKVIDIGCGVGGPLRNIATFSGANIVGLNNNDYQISRGRRIAQQSGLEGQASFLKGDFMKIPLPEATFDAAYAIEATCHAPDRVGVYSEIFRVLKPGGRFAAYEWAMTDLFDPQDNTHVALKQGIERGNGLPDLEPISKVVAAMREAGFEVIEYYDRAPSSDIPWYYPLTARLTPKGIFHTSLGRYIARKGLYALEYLKIAPGGSSATLDMLQKGADALVGAAETGIFSPMYWVLCRKPE